MSRLIGEVISVQESSQYLQLLTSTLCVIKKIRVNKVRKVASDCILLKTLKESFCICDFPLNTVSKIHMNFRTSHKKIS